MTETDLEQPFLPPLLVHESRPEEDLIRQLYQLGHFRHNRTGIEAGELPGLAMSDDPVRAAVSSYQDWHGLKVDGTLGENTQAHMNRPRCGIPDVMAQRGCTSKWAFTDVTFAHRLQFSSMSAADIQRAVEKALSQWNDVCGLRLTYQMEMTTANIWAQALPIDQAGGTLAWSYLPGCGSGRSVRLEQRYDTREQWSFDFLVAVLSHEIGHAIGLDHTNVPNNLMNPFYNEQITKPQASWDIPQAVSRYPVAIPPIPNPPPIPPAGDMLVSSQYQGMNFVGTLVRR